MNTYPQSGLGRWVARHTFRLLRALLFCAIASTLPARLLAAEVATDQADYAPGTTATITGNGFAAGETVVLQVVHVPDEGQDHQPWAAQADGAGAFTTSWQVADDCAGATLRLTALGQSSGLQAETTFTDAPFFGVRLTSAVAVGPGCMRSVTTPTNVQVYVTPGATYRFSFTLNTNGITPCFTTSNALGPGAIVMSLGPTFGNQILVALRSGAANVYTNTSFIPATACGTSPLHAFCDSGAQLQVLGNTPPPDRPLQLIASINCSNQVACADTPPTIVCSTNFTIIAPSNSCAATVFYNPPAASGTPAPVVTCFPPSGSSFPVGISTVFCTASNSAGGASCFFLITVRDTLRPTIVCPPSRVLSNDPGQCSAVLTFTPTVFDNCSNFTVTCLPPSGTAFPLGGTLVSCRATDASGNTNSCFFTVIVQDREAPTIHACTPPLTVPASAGCQGVVPDARGLVSATDNCTPAAGLIYSQSPAPGTLAGLGTTLITITVRDGPSNNLSQCTTTLIVVDTQPPVISQCAPDLTAPAGDGCQAAVPDVTGTVAALDDCTPAGGLTISQSPAAGTLVGIGTTLITITVQDGYNSSQCTATFEVVNTPPIIDPLTGPGGPLALGGDASVAVTFTDAEAGQSHTLTIEWGDDTSDTLTLAAGVSSALLSHVYAEPGVYAVNVTVSDPCASVSQLLEYIVVYDPEGGFVTGGGWILSPPGAFAADPSLTGKANFGFVAKYHQGATVPSGETQFQFKAGDLNFHSTEYEWLVISGAKAQYRGTGTINGAGPYQFQLTATDGQLPGGGGVDKFRIKITGPGGVVYDNCMGTPEDLKHANPQELGGGSIVIHK